MCSRCGWSYVFDSADRLALDLRPVDGRIQLLVDETDGADVVASYDIQAEGHLGRWLAIVWCVDDPLYRRLEDLGGRRQSSSPRKKPRGGTHEIGLVVAGGKNAD